MRVSRSALLRACLLASIPIASFAQTEPVIIEAESGTLGANLATGVSGTTTYVTTTVNRTTPPSVPHIGTYSVTFPAGGNWELYARIQVGPAGANDDSFYFGNGFGTPVPETGNWSLQNEANTGFTNAASTVLVGGSAGSNVFKWIKITGAQGPNPWVVPAGALTQTFQWGSREDGLWLDKFAFGRQGVCYTVANLDNGQSATGTCPPPPPPDPPPYTRTAPPIGAGITDKYLGAAWSPGTASLSFANYWNQVTPENGGKWGSAEPQRDVFNWAQADEAYALAKANGFPFKWHTLIWGNQQPAWIEGLSTAEQREEIEEWYAAVAARYPDIDQIEVVNEPLHDPPRGATNGNYIEALGGNGATGWDWVITSFQLARQHFPNAELILNDYSITNDNNATTNYIALLQLLKDRGLVDAIGDQAHAFSTTEAAPMTNHRNNLNRLAALGMPIYITELDIDGVLQGVVNHETQLNSFKRIFPVFWEHPAVKGVTIWGYVRGFHWRNNTGAWLLYPNGGERPALQWLISYVQNKPAVVPTQGLAVPETDGTMMREIYAFFESNGWAYDDDKIRTAVLMYLNPQAFTDSQGTTWAGGLANYNGSNAQAVAFEMRYDSFGGPGAILGRVIANDEDANAVFSQWQINSDPSGKFVIDAGSGYISLAKGATLDRETATSYNITVSVWDGYTRSAPGTVVINVLNLNDVAPVIGAGQEAKISDGDRGGVRLIEATDGDDATDPGFSSLSNWKVVGGTGESVFTLDSTGVLKIKAPLMIDFSLSGYSVLATVSDGVNTSETQTISVLIPNNVKMCQNNKAITVAKQSAMALLRQGASLGGCGPRK